jgi:hypothetical protein
MDIEVFAALIAAVSALLVAILGSVISYVSALRRQETEIRSLEARLEKENAMEMARLEKEQQLKFDLFKKEQIENIRIGYYQNTLEAYKKVWALMPPLAYYTEPGQEVIIRNETGVYLNSAVVQQFFLSFRDFFYSESGIFLSKEFREKIFEVRDFIKEVETSGEKQPDGWVKISNNKAKQIENGLDWIRKNIRRGAGLENDQKNIM